MFCGTHSEPEFPVIAEKDTEEAIDKEDEGGCCYDQCGLPIGSLEFVFYQSGVLVEIKGKKQSRRSHFLVQNAFQVIDSSAVA